ncbi:MAG: hypothetical protein ABI905_03285 [Betaproteobacteria bacterium]
MTQRVNQNVPGDTNGNGRRIEPTLPGIERDNRPKESPGWVGDPGEDPGTVPRQDDPDASSQDNDLEAIDDPQALRGNGKISTED